MAGERNHIRQPEQDVIPAVNNALFNAQVECDYNNAWPESGEIRIINQALI